MTLLYGIISVFSCTSARSFGEYRHVAHHEGSSLNTEKSEQKIANGATWQLFFTLKKPEKCIKMVFSSKMLIQTLKEPLSSEINTYYIVEKLVDISRYKGEKQNMLYEIGRNFDLRWNASPLVVLCTDAADPLKKLDPGLYRIRFTGLTSSNFYYRIEIYSAQEQVIFGF